MEQKPEHVSLSVLHEYVFRSDVPVIGPLIARFRSTWHSVAGKWPDRAIIQQQNEYNRAIAQQFAELDRQLAELDQRLIYTDREMTELTRTVAELTQQVIQLRHALEMLQTEPGESHQQ